MKRRLMFLAEIGGACIACIGIGLVSVPVALIVAGMMIVVACEVNQ